MRKTPQPSSRPAPAATSAGNRTARCTATASSAIPHAATPAKYPSAETATQIAVGATATNGAARRAVCSSASARTAITTAAVALEPTSRHSSPAQAPPCRPIRSSHTNVSSAPGGCPET